MTKKPGRLSTLMSTPEPDSYCGFDLPLAVVLGGLTASTETTAGVTLAAMASKRSLRALRISGVALAPTGADCALADPPRSSGMVTPPELSTSNRTPAQPRARVRFMLSVLGKREDCLVVI